MANLIFISESIREPYLSLSNGSTDVLLTGLGLCGSAMAEKNWQESLLRWLLEHDQSVFGVGTVGFNLVDLPWRRSVFSEAKEFLHRVAAAASQEKYWTAVDYRPDQNLLRGNLAVFSDMLEALPESAVDWKKAVAEDKPPSPRICLRHGLLLTRYGCLACNDR